MAEQKLFLEKKAHLETVGNSMSTTYCFDPKRECLTVFWKEEKIYQCKARLGDAFVVDCWGGTPKVHKLKLPHRNADLLMWLFSFSKSLRTHSMADFEELLDHQREQYAWWNYSEDLVKDEKFAFALCNRSDCGGVHHIAAYVADDLSKEEVIEVLRGYRKIRFLYYPEYFIKKVLKNRFGITEAEVEENGILGL